MLSRFTGAAVDALSIRANWLGKAAPGSMATIGGVDAAGRTFVDVGGVRFVYGVGLHRAANAS
jgi:hypothetical protein